MGLANLTVKMGCSHYKLTGEVERSAVGRERIDFVSNLSLTFFFHRKEYPGGGQQHLQPVSCN